MLWLISIFVGMVLLYPIVVILTDGRYFGKGLMHWVYDKFGPHIFGSRNETGQWQEMVKRLKLRGDEKILDIGTAAGDLPLAIATMPDFHGQIMGIDWSVQMIATATERAREYGIADRVNFQVADVRHGLSFDENEFDVIFCLGLLETLPQAEKILQDFSKVLNSNGILVLSLYRGWAALSVALSYDWYKQHLSALGFRDLQIAPCRRNQDVIIARL